MNNEQLAKLNEVYEFVQSLKAHTSIPFDVEQAVRARLNIEDFAQMEVSAKDADSEDQAVSEAGSGSYNVLSEPVGFLQVTIGANTYYLPYYNA